MADATGTTANTVLQPHRKRKLRAFLHDHRDDAAPEVGALWATVYGRTVVDHRTALAVETECASTDRTVGDVLEGWRPAALGGQP